MNFFDTADVYSFGQSERLLGQAFKNLGVGAQGRGDRHQGVRRFGPGPNDRGASRGHIMDSVQGSLERLQVDHIDLYQIHGNDTVTPIDETLRALDDLIRQGLVRYVGVSNWAAWQIARALGRSEAAGYARFETLQAYYSIAGRDLERELVPMLTEEGLGLMVWSPLAGGLLSGKFGRRREHARRARGAPPSTSRRSTRSAPGPSSTSCARSARRTASRSPAWRWPGCSPSRT